jgi:hypothetical protein
MGEEMKAATITKPVVDGSGLLKICNYDHRLTGAVIASQDDNWQELLRTITPGHLQRNVALIVWQIREALGKEDFDLAREISDGVN